MRYKQYDLFLTNALLESIPDKAKRAVPRALKRAALSGRKVTRQGILDTYTIKRKDIDAFTKTYAYSSQAGFSMRSTLFSKERFKVRPTDRNTTGRNHKLVKVQIRKDRPMEPFYFAFKHKGHIFQRYGDERLPLYFHRAPSLKGMVSAAVGEDEVLEEMQETFKKGSGMKSTGRLTGESDG